MEYIFVLFMNGWVIEVDRFYSRYACEEQVRKYTAAQTRNQVTVLAWCEHKPRA